jgi:hypothetical protein
MIRVQVRRDYMLKSAASLRSLSEIAVCGKRSGEYLAQSKRGSALSMLNRQNKVAHYSFADACYPTCF